jgi:hypothetical protein
VSKVFKVKPVRQVPLDLKVNAEYQVKLVLADMTGPLVNQELLVLQVHKVIQALVAKRV